LRVNSKNMTPGHEIILAQTTEQRQECYDVRIAVFHLEQEFPLETEIDEPVILFLNFYKYQQLSFCSTVWKTWQHIFS